MSVLSITRNEQEFHALRGEGLHDLKEPSPGAEDRSLYMERFLKVQVNNYTQLIVVQGRASAIAFMNVVFVLIFVRIIGFRPLDFGVHLSPQAACPATGFTTATERVKI